MAIKTNIATGIFLACFAAGTAFAQSEETTTEPEVAVGGALSLGEDLNNSPAIGQPYAKEKHGDWTIRCVKTEAETDPCQLFQLMTDGEGAPVAEFNLNILPGGGQVFAGANVVTPLETLLTAQLTIRIDEASAKRYPFAFCSTIGCVSRIGLTEADVAGYKRGNTATIIMVPAISPDKPVGLNLSLTGFTAAFDVLNGG